MSKTVRILGILFAGLAFCAAAVVIWRIATGMRRSAGTIGNISAVSAAINEEMNGTSPRLAEFFSQRPGEWSFAGDAEYDAIISDLSKSHNLDPPPGWQVGKRLLDGWGNRYEICCRRLADGNWRCLVISRGPDGLYGTGDDVVAGGARVAPPKREN